MLRITSKLRSFPQPAVMGILNCTPDSFAMHCSSLQPQCVLDAVTPMIQAGVDILDIGACSTRPNAQPVSEDIEWQRLTATLAIIRQHYPDLLISVDTFRASVAQRAIEQYGVQIINDVSGLSDPDMLSVLTHARVPYILTHPRAACLDWTPMTDVVSALLTFFAEKLDYLHRHGVVDVIIDPGFGFGKSIQQNYTILSHLPVLQHLSAPILVGLSRKSMLYQPLGLSPDTALNATTAAHVLAILGGANILRVHDVKEARQALGIVSLYNNFQLFN